MDTTTRHNDPNRSLQNATSCWHKGPLKGMCVQLWTPFACLQYLYIWNIINGTNIHHSSGGFNTTYCMELRSPFCPENWILISFYLHSLYRIWGRAIFRFGYQDKTYMSLKLYKKCPFGTMEEFGPFRLSLLYLEITSLIIGSAKRHQWLNCTQIPIKKFFGETWNC